MTADASTAEAPSVEAPSDRRDWMGLLARAPAERLAALWEEFGEVPQFEWLRAPEIGSVMVRGRAGGTGAPFNLGEMTVTRAALRLPCGAVGHGVVQGRDKSQARIAALADALLQTARRPEIEMGLIAPLAAEEKARRDARAGRAAATKVEFLTLMRGENA